MSRYRILPSEKIRKEIREMTDGMKSGEKIEGNPVESLMEKVKLLIVEELLEKEVEEFLQRPYYQRKKAEGELKGYRNGYEPRKLKTAEGAFLTSCILWWMRYMKSSGRISRPTERYCFYRTFGT